MKFQLSCIYFLGAGLRVMSRSVQTAYASQDHKETGNCFVCVLGWMDVDADQQFTNRKYHGPEGLCGRQVPRYLISDVQSVLMEEDLGSVYSQQIISGAKQPF